MIIIDVREPDELVNEGVIPGATNIPMGQVETALRMSPTEFEATYGRPQPQREDPVIFICRVGRRAAEMGDHVRYFHLGCPSMTSFIFLHLPNPHFLPYVLLPQNL